MSQAGLFAYALAMREEEELIGIVASITLIAVRALMNIISIGYIFFTLKPIKVNAFLARAIVSLIVNITLIYFDY